MLSSLLDNVHMLAIPLSLLLFHVLQCHCPGCLNSTHNINCCNQCDAFTVSLEIQELDSNMQYLVYENHSKFIKASETIREVGCQGLLPKLTKSCSHPSIDITDRY